MSYASKDTSVQDSAPVLLFEFVQGATTYRYCTLAESFYAKSAWWNPGVIVPSNFSSTDDGGKDSLTLRIPTSSTLAQTFIGGAPDAKTTVTVYRCHFDDTDYIVYWTGEVTGNPYTRGVMTLECESALASMQRKGPGPVFSRNCRHALFGPGCNLVAASFAIPATVIAVAGKLVTISTVVADDRIAGGSLKAPDGTERVIMAKSGFDLTLIWPIRSLADEIIAHPAPGGFSVNLYPHCDGSLTMCRDVYGNVGNRGGFDGIPPNNPMRTPINQV